MPVPDRGQLITDVPESGQSAWGFDVLTTRPDRSIRLTVRGPVDMPEEKAVASAQEYAGIIDRFLDLAEGIPIDESSAPNLVEVTQ